MSKKLHTIVIAAILLLCIIGCAKKGTITGGEKDETPPKFIKAIPPNFSTNFDKKEIRIYFDEYIKIKDPQKNIVISPPMDPKPNIYPLGGASKYIKIEILDTLLENTTYSINFGESVVDNNEGNPFSFFRYVFSTGNYLDSLSIKGSIIDALAKNVDPFITVALYEIDSAFTDSLIYKEVPRYISSTSDSISDFKLENLKEGQYKLIALKDKASNYTYQPKQDKIGFYNEVVSLPEDTAKVYQIEMFEEILDFKALRPKQQSKNTFIFGYEGIADSVNIKLLSETPENFNTRILPDKEKDTLYYWFKPFFEADSLIFEVSNKNYYKDTLIGRFRDQYKDSLVLRPTVSGTLTFDENYGITANTPVDTINEQLISLMDKDSSQVPFSILLDSISNEATFEFERSEENSYQVTLLPEAITDFIGNTNDTIYYNFQTKKKTDYGTIFLTLEGVKEYPVIAQVITEKGEVIKEKIAESQKVLVFENLEPGKYDIRVILDANKNGMWDTGNFLKGIQPEKVFYYPELTEVRANWELKQTFILSTESENPNDEE